VLVLELEHLKIETIVRVFNNNVSKKTVQKKTVV
jgi:hypothetical protein